MKSNLSDSPTADQHKILWAQSGEAMFVADRETGCLTDVNLESEVLTGHPNFELIGIDKTLLLKADERSRVERAFQEAWVLAARFHSFHIRTRDGRNVPVSVSSSRPFQSQGRALVMAVVRDLIDLEDRKSRLTTQSWVPHAYAAAAGAMPRTSSSTVRMRDICEAITADSPFVLAWVAFPRGGHGESLHIAGKSGPASRRLGVDGNWSENTLWSRGMVSRCLRQWTDPVCGRCAACRLL